MFIIITLKTILNIYHLLLVIFQVFIFKEYAFYSRLVKLMFDTMIYHTNGYWLPRSDAKLWPSYIKE